MAKVYDKTVHEFVSMSISSKALKAAVDAAEKARTASLAADANVAAIKSAELVKAGVVANGARVGRSQYTGEWQVMVHRGTDDPVDIAGTAASKPKSQRAV